MLLTQLDIATSCSSEGKKSVSIRVTLRADDRTLTVEEADKVSKKILNDLKFKMGLELRS